MPTCDLCEREFATPAALAQHLKDKHGSEGSSPQSATQGGEQKPKAVRKQKRLRKRNFHPTALVLAAVAVAAGVGVYFVIVPSLAGPPFPCITAENWIHVHPYLTIDIEGKNVTIPNGVGQVQGGTCFEPIHTHDASGILHIELSQSDSRSHNYTLGDFFTIWSFTVISSSGTAPTLNGKTVPVEFSPTDILGFKTNSTHHVVLLVDGHPSTDWGSLNLETLAYCGASSRGAPCYPTACPTATSCADPLWKGTATYPYGTSHTIVIEFAKV